jgi:signal transduction histidine kinase/ligand-binding sensor domain-containing protein
MNVRSRVGRLALVASVLALPLAGERLPLRVYSVDDGLAGDEINALLQDSQGFLWIATDSGLSRFDGARFVNYDSRHGLPSPNITALQEGPKGSLLVGTTAGLAWLNPRAAPPARPFSPALTGALRFHRVGILLADGSATWLTDVGAGSALFRFEKLPLQDVPGKVRPSNDSVASAVTALAADGQGGFWVGGPGGLHHLLAGGQWLDPPPQMPAGWSAIEGLLLDHHQRLWVVSGGGLSVVATAPPGRSGAGGESHPACGAPGHLPSAAGEVCRIELAELGARLSGRMKESRDGTIWMAADTGVVTFDGERFRGYSRANGLPPGLVTAIAEDRDGEIWIGTRSRGLVRLARSGFSTFDAPDTLAGLSASQLLEDRQGEVIAWESSRQHGELAVFDGGRFQDVTPAALIRSGAQWRGRNQVAVAAPDGELWLAAVDGLWRLPAVDRSSSWRDRVPQLRKAPAEMGELNRIFRDSRGTLWVGSLGSPDPARGLAAITLARWDEANGYRGVAAVERYGRGAPSAFAEDRAGNLWIGFSGGGLVRLRGDVADLYLPDDGVPLGGVSDLLVDRQGRLWVASSIGGACRVEQLAGKPRFVSYNTAQGLSTDRVLCLAEDASGLLYLGHGKGIDVLDPATGHVHQLGVADGLPTSTVTSALRARDGSLWFGTPSGPVRYQPSLQRASAAPTVLMSALRLGGVPIALPPLGAHDLAGFELAADRNQVEAEFTGISFRSGDGLRYQYRLAGTSTPWSLPRTGRSVLLGNLASGTYRMEVLAVTPDDVVSSSPATLSFTILRPVWQRWWFILLSTLTLAGLVLAVHRQRVARVVELERMRTRIAADLHDDLNSSLARISILSEVGRRQLEPEEQSATTTLANIGETARELMEATGDMVWAIDARHDDLNSLLARIRRFAGDLLSSRGVEVACSPPLPTNQVRLPPEARRELYLVLKEALHNAARHASARRVWIEVGVVDTRVVAEVRDDGVGFATAAGDGHSGNGLRNLRERARRMGGILTVDSAPGAGTRVRLTLQL